ncbi:metallophosphoesterase [Sinomicrobium pectinilyticum]|uniref:Metallophosphoesterase n=1 Tax=Sinomicrobium pectinilyticum TaxID=1084421 RepID=A0A3N0DNY4_SINP1|nr:calcineurin-like phosphoesterase family protein [Sinomicrobium pectinilyticum]RNL77365.1 metallophosphoesterase [Sinomicrobium pectinilyticum]
MQNRRDFLKKVGLATGGISALGLFPAGAYGNLPDLDLYRPVKVKGRVASGSKGLARVTVTDGLNVVQTDSGGYFEFTSNNGRNFIYISLPSGYVIDRLENGSADYFKPLVKNKDNQEFHFQLRKSEVSDENHHFLVLADTQIQNEYEAEQLLTVATPDLVKTVKDINDPNLFGIGCGDLVFDNLSLFKDYNAMVKQTDIPFFQVIGNHDMDLGGRSDESTTGTFNSHFGPTYYSFNRGEIHYVVLDDVFFIGRNKKYIGYITEEQLAWLEKDLSFIEPGTTVVVSLHIPTYTGSVKRYPDQDHIGGIVNNRKHLYKILEPFTAHIMSGHTHFNDNMKLADNLYEHCHGTVCGAWWSGPICHDGTPSGYGVYQVKGSGLSWHYKSTGMEKDHQFRVYKKGEHPDHPQKCAANVWNWDEDWKVVWYEDGMRKGEPERVVARDPLSIRLHEGPDLPERRKWVEPQLNDHMFFFEPGASASNVVVEVTDRFGNVFKETVR